MESPTDKPQNRDEKKIRTYYSRITVQLDRALLEIKDSYPEFAEKVARIAHEGLVMIDEAFLHSPTEKKLFDNLECFSNRLAALKKEVVESPTPGFMPGQRILETSFKEIERILIQHYEIIPPRGDIPEIYL